MFPWSAICLFWLLCSWLVKWSKQWVFIYYLGRVKRIWYLSPMRAAKVQASLRIRAVSPEPSLLAHTSSETRGTFRQKARSLSHLNGWACAVKICHDGLLEDTNSLDGAHLIIKKYTFFLLLYECQHKHKITNVTTCVLVFCNWTSRITCTSLLAFPSTFSQFTPGPIW